MKEYTGNPRAVGEQYTFMRGDGSSETRVVTAVERSTIFGGDDDGWLQESELVSRTEAADPTTLPCGVCGKVIGETDWAWAAIRLNGPVHVGCFMSDEELRAEYEADQTTPCTGCDAVCDDCEGGGHVLHFADGVNNATIFPDGRIERHPEPLSGSGEKQQ